MTTFMGKAHFCNCFRSMMLTFTATNFFGEVNGRMTFRCRQFKIFWAIIEFIAIYMMDIFARLKRSTEFLFKNITSNINLLPIDTHLSITGVHFGIGLRGSLFHGASLWGTYRKDYNIT